MNRENELFARVVAQQMQITALHTALADVLTKYADAIGVDDRARYRAALSQSEPHGHLKFAEAVMEASAAHIDSVRKELETKHADALATRDKVSGILLSKKL